MQGVVCGMAVPTFAGFAAAGAAGCWEVMLGLGRGGVGFLIRGRSVGMAWVYDTCVNGGLGMV